MQIQVQQPGTRKTRIPRNPTFPLAGHVKPMYLYPLMAHPVLPGETMNSASLKMRVLSNPIKNPLCGAWLETWFVYVKLTDIAEELSEMFISDTFSSTSYEATADNKRFFVKNGNIDWVRLCTDAVHDAYFLDEGETARSHSTETARQIKINDVSWMQNCIFEDADTAVPITDASDTYEHLRQWMMTQQMGMTDLTYEKYLEQYGVKLSANQGNKPEILSYGTKWKQPTNAIDPTDGSPSSVWYWAEDFKMTKPKHFKEPGFVIALAAVRPKFYQKNLDAAMLMNLWGFSDFFPAYTLDDPTAGIKEIQTDNDIFVAGSRTDAGEKTILYDHRDLLSHGEQFVNTSNQTFQLPEATGLLMNDASTPQDIRGQYCTESDVANLFVSATASDQFVSYEGICFLNLSGHVQDTTR